MLKQHEMIAESQFQAFGFGVPPPRFPVNPHLATAMKTVCGHPCTAAAQLNQHQLFVYRVRTLTVMLKDVCYAECTQVGRYRDQDSIVNSG